MSGPSLIRWARSHLSAKLKILKCPEFFPQKSIGGSSSRHCKHGKARPPPPYSPPQGQAAPALPTARRDAPMEMPLHEQTTTWRGYGQPGERLHHGGICGCVTVTVAVGCGTCGSKRGRRGVAGDGRLSRRREAGTAAFDGRSYLWSVCARTDSRTQNTQPSGLTQTEKLSERDPFADQIWSGNGLTRTCPQYAALRPTHDLPTYQSPTSPLLSISARSPHLKFSSPNDSDLAGAQLTAHARLRRAEKRHSPWPPPRLSSPVCPSWSLHASIMASWTVPQGASCCSIARYGALLGTGRHGSW
jgi:hypothetical protein